MRKNNVKDDTLQSKVIELLTHGLVAKEIAMELNQPRRRIQYFIEISRNKYNARNIHHLVAIALREQIIN